MRLTLLLCAICLTYMAPIGMAQETELPASLSGFFKPGMQIRIPPRNSPSDPLRIVIFEDEQYAMYKDALELPLEELAAKYPQVAQSVKQASDQASVHLAQLQKESPDSKYGEPEISVSHESLDDCWTIVGAGSDYLLLKSVSEPSQKRVVATHSISSINWMGDLRISWMIDHFDSRRNQLDKIQSWGIPENGDPKWVEFCKKRMAKLDKNGDGKLFKSEWSVSIGDFAKYDTDGDGSITLVEYYTNYVKQRSR